MLSRDQILGRRPDRMTVEVPEWGDSVLIQALTVSAAQAVSTEDSIVDLVIASVIHEDGSPMFTAEDREHVRRLPFAPIKRIANAVIVFNKISNAAVEELTKNSGTGPSDASSSA